jgi:thiol:disulfide interchange protein DsbG
LALAVAALGWPWVPAVPRAQAATALSPMSALRQSSWIAEGSAHPRHGIYVFMDANCPYCHSLWLALRPYYRKGLQVRDILVGVISASSPGKAAAIFDASDPSAALRLNERRWGHGPDRRGGIAPVAHPGRGDLRRLAYNQVLMEEFGLQGTPALVFADGQGEVYAIRGMPAKGELPEIVRTAVVPGHGAQAKGRG